jgi:hypothetical protein
MGADPPASLQRNQAPEYQHDQNYDNDVAHGWLTGHDGSAESATGKPGFDKSNAWRQGRNPKLRED